MKYKSFHDLAKKIKPLKLNGWNLALDDHIVILKEVEKTFIILKYDLFIEEYLKLTCAVYEWLLLPEGHIYVKYNRSTKDVTATGVLVI